MDTLTQTFEERLQEIDAYLDLLEAIEREVRTGAPKLGGTAITAQQQKILYSSVYLQLYNLVEATVTWCIDAVAVAASDGKWMPIDLSAEMRKEWIRVHAKTHANLSTEKRMASANYFFEQLVLTKPISPWTVERGGGGNWDDTRIYEICVRLGCNVKLSKKAESGIKRIIRDDKNALGLVKYLRNNLAHGKLSFSECGAGVTVVELRDIKDRTALYLREVVAAFQAYIDNHYFLVPSRRPSVGAA